MTPSPACILSSPVQLIRSAEEGFTGVRARSSAAFAKVRPGVYAARSAWDALAPWQRYSARVHAYALSHPDAVFCLESAAALLGLPIFGEPRDIHVLAPAGSGSHRRGDVCVHSSSDPRAIQADAIVTTTWAETTLDLLRVLPPAFALAVGDASVRSGRASVPMLRALASEQVSRRGTRSRLPWLWERIDGDAESVGESVSRAVIEWCGFPHPELQVTVTSEGHDDRLDFLWRRYGIGGESDGYGKYLLSSDGDPLSALRREKSREDRLRRTLAGLARWEWADAMDPARLARKLARAGLPRVRTPEQGMLRTLGANPRSR